MIPRATAEAAARDLYGTFFDMFPDWYKKRCVERCAESLARQVALCATSSK